MLLFVGRLLEVAQLCQRHEKEVRGYVEAEQKNEERRALARAKALRRKGGSKDGAVATMSSGNEVLEQLAQGHYRREQPDYDALYDNLA